MLVLKGVSFWVCDLDQSMVSLERQGLEFVAKRFNFGKSRA